MKTNAVVRGLTFGVLSIGLCFLAYSCSENDDYIENVRTLSKRAISFIENNEEYSGVPDVYGVEEGSSSGISNDGNFNVSVSWTKGYTTRSPYSTVSITASSNGKLKDCNIQSASGGWIGSSYDIHGTIYYNYMKRETRMDVLGNYYTVDIRKNGSTSFDLNPQVSYITDTNDLYN